MKAISIKQPWASLICSGIKDIENRTWKTNFRGKVLIHASAKPWNYNKLCHYLTNYLDNENLELQKIIRDNNFSSRWIESLPTSAIIGSVEIVDCIVNHPSIWAEKSLNKEDLNPLSWDVIKPTYNWVLANPILFDKPIPAKGRLQFWDYPQISS